MTDSEFVKKIKYYSILAFVLPLITINSCLLLYKFLGNFEAYPSYMGSEKKLELMYDFYTMDKYKLYPYSFVKCPKYKFNHYIVTTDNKIFNSEIKSDIKIDNPAFQTLSRDLLLELKRNKKIKSQIYESDKSKAINPECVKNNRFLYPMLNNFGALEKILLNAKKNNTSGFANIKNPYLYGEVSISRTARYFPATLIFKPLLILSSIFLFLYWRNNLNLFLDLKSKNVLNSFSKSFFYLGILSFIFLILHATLLGLDYNSKLFNSVRKVIIILFILFEIFAQISLTKILFKFKENLVKYINLLIIKIKVIFVIIVVAATLIIFSILIWGNISSEMKHVLEWNYFSILLIYYFLSRLLWR